MTTRTDAVDRILLTEAAAAWTSLRADEVVVLDDTTGGLAAAVSDHLVQPDSGSLRVWCDSLRAERAVREVWSERSATALFCPDLNAELLRGARAVIMRAPKSLTALDEIAEAAAVHAGGPVGVLAGGRVKHLSRGMNSVLSRTFGTVTASLGRDKARVLRAFDPLDQVEPSYPRAKFHPELNLTVWAHGGAFAGAAIDVGTRTLLPFLDDLPSGPIRVVDLGCGTGILSTWVARVRPAAQVIAVDESWSACSSTAATATANGVADRIEVVRSDAAAEVADGSVDVVVCNPPFHRGTARDSDDAFAMFVDAARILVPSGHLWTVYNSHLPYRSALRRLVGKTAIVGQTPKFTVTRTWPAARA